MFIITKRFNFEAAHRLEDWPTDHQCHRCHGHSYQLIVALKDSTLLKGLDVVQDYGVISKIVKERIIDKYDHQYLNEILEVKNTTAEYLAFTFFYDLYEVFGKSLYYVEVKETDNSSALYIPEVYERKETDNNVEGE